MGQTSEKEADLGEKGGGIDFVSEEEKEVEKEEDQQERENYPVVVDDDGNQAHGIDSVFPPCCDE